MGDTSRAHRRGPGAHTERTTQMMSFSRPAMLPSLLKSLAIALVLAAAPVVAAAQDTAPPAPPDVAPGPGTIVATVGGEVITEADLAFAAEDIGADLNQIPPDQIRAVLLAQMIDLKLMAQAGDAQGLQDDELFKLRLSYLTDRALRRAYTKVAINDTITPEAIQAEYDKQIAAIPDEDEVHARHILVSTEDDAKALKAELDAGADFITLARANSIEPNAAQSGGDLGYFKRGVMVKPFGDAAFAMEVGQVSDPVQTQFGWHIIKVEDRRPAAKPTLDELTQQIGQQLYVERYRARFDELRKTATIDIPDAALAEQVNLQLGPLAP
jgi:peptidyl-prolyl cis-trans isomerase C